MIQIVLILLADQPSGKTAQHQLDICNTGECIKNIQKFSREH
jgi:hypothetical protein